MRLTLLDWADLARLDPKLAPPETPDYLLEPRREHVLDHAPARVQMVRFTREGQLLTFSPRRARCDLWDVSSGTHLRRLPDLLGRSLCVCPDGRTLLSGGDGFFTRYDLFEDRLTRHSWPGLCGDVSLSRCGRWMVAGCDETLHLAGPGGQERTFVASRVAFHPHNETIALALPSGAIQLRSLADWRLRSTLWGHRSLVWSLAFTPCGEYLVSGGGYEDREVRVWHARTGAPLHRLGPLAYGARPIRFLPGGFVVAERGTRAWNLPSGEVRFEHPEAEVTARLAVGGSLVGCAGSNQPDITLLKPDGSRHALLAAPRNADYLFSPDGAWLAVIAGEAVELWRLARDPRRPPLKELARTLAGKAEALSDGLVALWAATRDPELREALGRLAGETPRHSTLRALLTGATPENPQLDVLAAAMDDTELGSAARALVHRLPEEALAHRTDLLVAAERVPSTGRASYYLEAGDLESYRREEPSLEQLARRKSEPRLLSLVKDPSLVNLWWDGTSAGLDRLTRAEWKVLGSLVRSPELSRQAPPAEALELLGRDSRVLRKPFLRARLEGGVEARDVTFSPDGRLVAAAFYKGGVQVWEAATGRPVWESGCGSANEAAFSPDGRLLAGGGMSRWVACTKAWEVQWQTRVLGPCYGTVMAADGGRFAVVTEPFVLRGGDLEEVRLGGHRALRGACWRGNRVLTVDVDRVRLWDARSGELKASVRGSSGVLGSDFWVVDHHGTLSLYPLDESCPRWQVRHDFDHPESLQLRDDRVAVVDRRGVQVVETDGTAHPPYPNPCNSHSLYPRRAEFCPSGRLLARGDQDGGVTLWDTREDAVVEVLRGPGEVKAVAFHPWAGVLASAHTGGVCLWSVPVARELATSEQLEAWVLEPGDPWSVRAELARS